MEDELALQASLRLSDGLRIMSATVNHHSSMPGSASDPILRQPSMGRLSDLLPGSDPSAAKGDQQEERVEKTAEGTERVPKVAFSLVRTVAC